MSEKETPALEKKVTKKEARKAVFEKLSGALAEYKNKLDKKKFESNLRKASKLFAVELVKASKKNRKHERKLKAVTDKKETDAKK